MNEVFDRNSASWAQFSCWSFTWCFTGRYGINSKVSVRHNGFLARRLGSASFLSALVIFYYKYQVSLFRKWRLYWSLWLFVVKFLTRRPWIWQLSIRTIGCFHIWWFLRGHLVYFASHGWRWLSLMFQNWWWVCGSNTFSFAPLWLHG